MAEPETETSDITLQAAEVAADITEEDRPQERSRLVSAPSTRPRARAHAWLAAGHGRRDARAGSGIGWLVDQVIAMAPRLRVRNQAVLQAQFPGKSADDVRRRAHRGGRPRGRRRQAEPRAWRRRCRCCPPSRSRWRPRPWSSSGSRSSSSRSCTRRTGFRPRGSCPERMSAYVAAWAHRRGVFMIQGGVVLAAGSPLARLLRRRLIARVGPERGLAGPAAHRRRRGRVPQPQGDQQARPGRPARPAPQGAPWFVRLRRSARNLRRLRSQARRLPGSG